MKLALYHFSTLIAGFIVASSFIIDSSSLAHRWENFWLFKLLLLMNASAYVKHRCNTTKHSQLFTFLANKLLFNVVSVLRKKCWLVQYVSLSPKRKNMFHTKSTCCLTVKRIVDKLNMFHFYPNAKIWSHTKSTCDLTVKGICWSSSHLSHMLPFSLIFASKQKNASRFAAAANLNFRRKLEQSLMVIFVRQELGFQSFSSLFFGCWYFCPVVQWN